MIDDQNAFNTDHKVDPGLSISPTLELGFDFTKGTSPGEKISLHIHSRKDFHVTAQRPSLVLCGYER
jgi:hypothetical protein